MSNRALALITAAVAVFAGVSLWRVVASAADSASLLTPNGDEALLRALLDDETARAKTKNGSGRDNASPVRRYQRLSQPPMQASDQAKVRVALFKHYPVRRLQPQAGASCRSASGVLQGTIELTRISRESLVCQGGGAALIAVNNAPYQGSIELIRHGGDWLAINQVPLETYVASVVGAEMPSHWNKEALKAQAVAARSYALVHVVRPASARYHLGDSTRWQVYAGVGSTSSSTRQATQATEGQVLQFQGGLVESLYAASAQISAEAHGHLGASMSQMGAQALAQQGKNYAQILDRYYNGAGLARIRLDGD
jgi:hypothetical protein